MMDFKRTGLVVLLVFFLFLAHGAGPYTNLDWKQSAVAYEASSSSFFIHGGGLTSFGQTGSSSSFINYSAAGQAISGLASSASNFIAKMGILNAIFRSFKPSYEQVHYHWRNDDGTETTATSATGGTANTTITNLSKNTIKRLRFEISNEGGTDSISAQQFRIEYGLKVTTCAAIGSWTDVGAGAGDWDMGASQLTEAADTTNITVSSGGVADANNSFLTPNGGQRETTSQTGSLTVGSNNFVELEYAIQALNAATDSGTYCFRLTNAGSATNFVYTQYPEATLAAAASSITLTVDSGSTVAFGTLSYNSRATQTTRLKVDTNNTNGYTISAGRDRAIANVTLASNANSSININDTENGMNVFDGLGASCTDGTGPAVWPGSTSISTGLGFVLWKADINKETACWGTGTTETHTANRYAALQASAAASNFLSTTSNSPNPSYASIGWSIEIKQAQQNTVYTGDVIFTATTAP